MNGQKFFAVRIVVRHASGGSAQRDYVRGDQHQGRAQFAAWALGDMLMLLMNEKAAEPFTYEIHEIDFETVRENRLYHHTTH